MGLRQEIEKTGEHTYRLIVYPKVTHFPKRDQPHQIAFQLVAFEVGQDSTGVFSELEDNQFKLSGLWQFIPVCRPPCISICRNFTPKLLQYVQKMDTPVKKVRTLKSIHIPLLWKDAPVRPFRFNSKGGKDQGLPPFVSIKAVFLPHRDAFGFVELLSELVSLLAIFQPRLPIAHPQNLFPSQFCAAKVLECEFIWLA